MAIFIAQLVQLKVPQYKVKASPNALEVMGWFMAEFAKAAQEECSALKEKLSNVK